jgi:predicted short-subunit dehydrogenase-like oxidoreductase (DUF2520 family)
MDSKSYGIVGNGRLAKHLIHYFRLKHLNITQWHRSMDRSAHDVLARTEVVIIAIRDDAIEDFIKKNVWLKNKIVVHCSGSLVTKLAQGFHPLFNFTSHIYKPEKYEQIPFVIEKGKYSFRDVFPQLSNRSYLISKNQRPLYHALSVVSGNFPTILWQEVFTQFQKKLKLPPEILIPYIQNCLDEFTADPKESLTGPMVRKDKKTIEKNLKALKGSYLKDIYKTFSKRYR